MGLNGVDNNELDFVTVSGRQRFVGSDPPPEGRSSDKAEDHHHRLSRQKLRKCKFGAMDIFEREVNRLLADLPASFLKVTGGGLAAVPL